MALGKISLAQEASGESLARNDGCIRKKGTLIEHRQH